MHLTRRGLIGRAAAASGALIGGSLLAPRVVYAGAHGEAVFELAIPRGGGPVETRRTFELLGIRGVDGDAEVRARALDGRWSEWLPVHAADDHGPDADAAGGSGAGGSGAGRSGAGGSGAGGSGAGGSGAGGSGAGGSPLSDPVWTGPARAFELRSKRSLRGARVVLVDGGRGASASAKRYVDAELSAAAGQPKVIARSSWATAACRPRVPAIFGSVDLAFVHHTVSSNSYRPSQSAGMVRSICLFHKYGNGWNDIGYNFVVDRYGQIFEARAGGIDETIVGAQAGGYNVYSSGIALLGNFAGGGPPRRTFNSLAQLLAWKLSIHGIEVPGNVTVEVTRTGAPYSRYRAGTRVRLDRISGHRDADATTCPGAGMYRQLPRLRQAVRRMAGPVGGLAMQNQGTAAGSVSVGGILTSAGAPVPGATIEVERRSTTRGATLLATATTDANGAWAALVPLARNAQLRAVFRGDAERSAVVSSGLFATVPPQIALNPATQQATAGGVIEFTGSVSPLKPRITIAIAKQQFDGSYITVRTIRLRPDDDGAFARTIGFPELGQYQVLAHTSADDVNALGTSAPVFITVA